MYEQAAYKGKDKLKTVFIFSDNDVVQESFLEDIQTYDLEYKSQWYYRLNN